MLMLSHLLCYLHFHLFPPPFHVKEGAILPILSSLPPPSRKGNPDSFVIDAASLIQGMVESGAQVAKRAGMWLPTGEREESKQAAAAGLHLLALPCAAMLAACF